MKPNLLPKRILMTADTVGGVWTYALELSRAIEPYGIEVLLVTMGAPLSSAQRSEAELVPNVRVFESRYKLEWMEDPWLDLAASGDWLLELEAEFEPDLIHLNGYAHGILPWNAPVLMVGHSCVLSWWKAVRSGETPVEWNDYRQAVCAGLHAADLVVAPSQTMLSCLEEHYGELGNNRVIHNGRRGPRLLLAKKENLIFAAGRIWDKAKNISALVNLAPDLQWPLCIAGEKRNPCTGANERFAREDLLEHSRAKALGPLSPHELWHWFFRASIYALPAFYEPFGLTPLEAALSGCALVLGDIPSLREIWGDAAVFVEPNDLRALKAAFDQLIGNPGLLAHIADRARARASNYSPEKMAEGYLVAYADLLSGRTASNEPNAAQVQPEPEFVVCES